MNIYIYIYIYSYLFLSLSLSLYIYIYICIEREREIYIYRERERGGQRFTMPKWSPKCTGTIPNGAQKRATTSSGTFKDALAEEGLPNVGQRCQSSIRGASFLKPF